MAIAITIERETRLSKFDIRVLGVQIDIKLKWGSHVKKIQEKMASQTYVLTKVYLESNISKEATSILNSCITCHYI